MTDENEKIEDQDQEQADAAGSETGDEAADNAGKEPETGEAGGGAESAGAGTENADAETGDEDGDAGGDADAAPGADTKGKLAEYQKKLKELSGQHISAPLAEPKMPEKEREEAPEEWEQYRADIAVYKAWQSQHKTEKARVWEEIKKTIIEQRREFEQQHTPAEVESFMNWLEDDPEMQSSISRGRRNFDQVYDAYLRETRGTQAERRIAAVKKEGARFKAAKVNKRGTSQANRFAGLKYAGRPEYQELAESLAKEVKDLKRVDELVRNQIERDVMRVI
jgi:hypothetical protein